MRHFFTCIAVLLVVFIAAGALLWDCERRIDCDKRGGYYVKGTYGYHVCVEPKR